MASTSAWGAGAVGATGRVDRGWRPGVSPATRPPVDLRWSRGAAGREDRRRPRAAQLRTPARVRSPASRFRPLPRHRVAERQADQAVFHDEYNGTHDDLVHHRADDHHVYEHDNLNNDVFYNDDIHNDLVHHDLVHHDVDESDHAVLAQAIEIPIGVDERSLTDAAVAPDDLTRVETHCCKNTARKAVEIIADQNRTAVVVAHLLCEINLSRRHVFAICLDLNQATAGSVVRRDEDSVSARHRCRNVRGIVGRARILPQQAPVAQIKPYRPARSEENDLLDAFRLD